MGREPKLFKRGNTWWIRHYQGDRLCRESLQTQDKDIAERKRLQKEIALLPPDERPPVDPAASVTVERLASDFLDHAERYYRKPDGTPTGETRNFHDAIRPLLELFGREYVSDFGPRLLKVYRDHLVTEPNERGIRLSRNTVNGRVRRIKQIFRWGVENEIVRPETLIALASVPALRKNRSEAKETKAIEPVPIDDVNAIKPHVSRQVWAMVEVQLLTAARPGEVVGLRRHTIDTSGPIWLAAFGDDHKTAHHGRARELYIGPKAQAALQPFMDRPDEAYLFSPIEAERERRADGAESSRNPNSKPTETKTDRTLGECYSVTTYYRAIQRACNRAKVTPWSPHRLRHTAATEIRRQFGVEAAQVILGHSEISTTEIYAEKNRAAALDIAKQIG